MSTSLETNNAEPEFKNYSVTYTFEEEIYCWRCGFKCKSSWNYCPKCGAELCKR